MVLSWHEDDEVYHVHLWWQWKHVNQNAPAGTIACITSLGATVPVTHMCHREIDRAVRFSCVPTPICRRFCCTVQLARISAPLRCVQMHQVKFSELQQRLPKQTFCDTWNGSDLDSVGVRCFVHLSSGNCKEYICSYRKSLQKCQRKITTITRTSSRPMRTTIMTPSTPSTMTRTITTRTICTSEHSSTPLVVLPVLMLSHDPLGSSSLSLSSHVIRMLHMCVSL